MHMRIRNMIILSYFQISHLDFFKKHNYDGGNEGSDQLPNMPCRVNIGLYNTTVEAPLTLRLIPRTIPENFAANGPPPTAVLRRANASRKNNM